MLPFDPEWLHYPNPKSLEPIVILIVEHLSMNIMQRSMYQTLGIKKSLQTVNGLRFSKLRKRIISPILKCMIDEFVGEKNFGKYHFLLMFPEVLYKAMVFFICNSLEPLHR